MSAFFIFVNTAVPLQSFAAMELVSSDREPESLVTPCGRSCGDLYPCLGKAEQTARHLFGLVWGDLAKTAFNHAGRECRAAKNGGDTGGARRTKVLEKEGNFWVAWNKRT